MPDVPPPPSGDDRDWLNQRGQPNQPNSDDEIPASVAFMAMMRQAADRAQKSPRAQGFEKALRPDNPDAVPLAYVPNTPTELPEPIAANDVSAERPRRRARRTGEYEASVPSAPADLPSEAAADPSLIDEIAAGMTSAAVTVADDEGDDDGAGVPTPRKRSAGRARGLRRTVGAVGGFIRSLIIVAAAAGLTATIFTWWTPTGFLPGEVREDLSIAIATSDASTAVAMSGGGQPAVVVTPNYERLIGIVSGHRGPQNDPGAVCPDGLTEASINFDVAQRVVDALRARGYSVDLLDEFDPRLDNYQAAALISIHANTCSDFGEYVSGYLIAGPAARISARGNDQLLVDCVSRYYGPASGLQRRDGVTLDMTHYHNFREIHPLTPGAIIELGFMLADREVLTERTADLARGIFEGILCFVEPASMATQAPLIVPLTTPTPGA